MIEDVINEVRELFLDEGVDEQVLLELKTVTVPGNIVPVYNNRRRKCCAENLCRKLVQKCGEVCFILKFIVT